MNKIWSLYVATNQVTGKQYVGVATNPKQRWVEHRCGHGSKVLRSAVLKYGRDKIQFQVWCSGAKDTMHAMECVFIKLLHTKAPNGYNLTDGGEGSTGWKPGEETRRRMSARSNGARNAMYGKTHSDEAREKIRAATTERMTRNEVDRWRLSNLNRLAGRKPNNKHVVINGVSYDSIALAAKAFGVCALTISRCLVDGVGLYKAFDRVEHCRQQGRQNKGRKHTQASRLKMSQSRRRGLSPAAKPVRFNNIEYACMKDAAEAAGVNYSTLRDQFRKCRRTGIWPCGTGDVLTK
jgi:group I intron endonuclease